MRKLVSILMLVAIAVQLQWGSGLLIDYYINTEAYKELCKNKDFPALNCDGKCILAQKLQKQGQQTEDQSALLISTISFEYTFTCFLRPLPSISHTVKNAASMYYANYAYLAQLKLFKPPS